MGRTIRNPAGRWLAIVLLVLLSSAAGAAGDSVDPAALYEAHCAACHRPPVPHAPHELNFPLMSAEFILAAMNDGVMVQQAAMLSAAERQALAAHLSGARKTEARLPPSCDGGAAEFDTTQPPAVDGWGFDLASTRFIPGATAKLDQADVPWLKLKWAFAYPNAGRARSQPMVAAGAVYVGGQDGGVYALDLDSGCLRWRFGADAEVRTVITVTDWTGGAEPLAYFGDLDGNVYAIDARDGALRWKVRADAHPDVTITGSPRLYKDRLFVPLSSREWASAANPGYPCCTFRGGVVAFDAPTGKELWRTYAIADEPTPTGKLNSTGAPLQAPAGAPIWNSPTIDVKRNRLYVGTGEDYTSPAGDTSDSVLAMDLDDGELLWSYQSLKGDAWNLACFIGGGPNCPKENGPDLDVGAPPLLMTLPDGRDMLLVGQKSGDVFALDPDADGKLLWKNKIGKGGYVGGVHWGMAAIGDTLYVPNTDADVLGIWEEPGKPGLFALEPRTGGIRWFTPAEDVCDPKQKPLCDPGLSPAATAIPGVIFAGAYDGHLRAYDASTGAVIWDVDTNRSFVTVSGEEAHGGAIESDGALVVDGHVLINSGYSFGGRMPGNVLLVFAVAP